MKSIVRLIAIASLFMLTACANKPSDNDIVIQLINDNWKDCEALEEVKTYNDVAKIVDDFYLCRYYNNIHNKKLIEILK